MKMIEAVNRFLFDDRAPVVIDGRNIETDQELHGRNVMRLLDARRQLGDRWLLSRPVMKRVTR